MQPLSQINAGRITAIAVESKNAANVDDFDGMSVATSADGAHFNEIGPIIHKRDEHKSIFFTRSSDLIHWQRLSDELRCVAET